jgi:methylenetetrahydrofolate reductase (NADPH)
MRIDEIYEAAESPVFSFEFFPPKTDEGERTMFAALGELQALRPAFVSVTYGAGGATRDKTIDIVRRIKHEYDLEAMADFTCVNATVAELRDTLDQMVAVGIDNVLALRGDPPSGEDVWTKTEGGLEYSRELIELIAADYPFAIGAAAFPETHVHAINADDDLRFLKAKVDAGARFLITQVFFDNARFFAFVERARAIGIDVPIVPGIMPITSFSQLTRMTEMCGATIPDHLLSELRARQGDDEAVLDFGVAYATLQCAELLAGGAPGIHFYTLNRSPATRAILSALRLIRPWARLERHAPAGPGTPDPARR